MTTCSVESNPARHACQWCTDRPAAVFAFRMPATTVRVCARCLSLMLGAIRAAHDFDEAMRRVEAATSDEAFAEHTRLALGLGHES